MSPNKHEHSLRNWDIENALSQNEKIQELLHNAGLGPISLHLRNVEGSTVRSLQAEARTGIEAIRNETVLLLASFQRIPYTEDVRVAVKKALHKTIERRIAKENAEKFSKCISDAIRCSPLNSKKINTKTTTQEPDKTMYTRTTYSNDGYHVVIAQNSPSNGTWDMNMIPKECLDKLLGKIEDGHQATSEVIVHCPHTCTQEIKVKNEHVICVFLYAKIH